MVEVKIEVKFESNLRNLEELKFLLELGFSCLHLDRLMLMIDWLSIPECEKQKRNSS